MILNDIETATNIRTANVMHIANHHNHGQVLLIAVPTLSLFSCERPDLNIFLEVVNHLGRKRRP
jgi:hypothetical protein